MENPGVNQLPEVGSLPDGFVESTEDPIAAQTLALEQDELLGDCKYESVGNLDSPLELGIVGNEDANKSKLSTKERVADSVEAAEVADNDCMEYDTSSSVSEASLRMTQCSITNDQVGGTSNEGFSGPEAISRKDVLSSERDETLKIKKQDTSDVKRKNVKRTFKTEKEFLEFTLKYQQVLSERDGAVAVRDKLESLCRELQRQNKMLMNECKKVSTEGQNLRLDLSNKFQDAIKDVSNKLEEQKNESLSQLKENEMLRNKLKHFADQYTLAEQQFAQKLKHKTLELQIADLKLKQHEEKSIQEQSQIKFYAEQVSQLLATEKNLRLQLTADGEKFQQFQEAMQKSNEVFETFKQEIKKTEKSIKELKKENAFLRSKTEKTDVTLLELVEERERLKKQVEKAKNQKEILESLCRSLQAERKETSGKDSCSVPI